MSKTSRRRTLPLGTYTDGSCRAEDRIDALADALLTLHLSRADRPKVIDLPKEARAVVADLSRETSELDEILDELIQVAENYLPEFCRLGNLEGDGACFGVWADVESARQAVQEGEVWAEYERRNGGFVETEYAKYHGDQPVLSTIHKYVPKGDLYLVISDHGNVSLYRSLGKGNSREIWGVV
jgi:hypothetical protein